jgi:predicted Zn-dependent peptidase
VAGTRARIPDEKQRIDAVTPALLQEVFKKYFPLDRYTAVTLVPEAAAQ